MTMATAATAIGYGYGDTASYADIGSGRAGYDGYDTTVMLPILPTGWWFPGSLSYCLARCREGKQTTSTFESSPHGKQGEGQ